MSRWVPMGMGGNGECVGVGGVLLCAVAKGGR